MSRKCVICDTDILMTQKRCPNCGWKYDSDNSNQYKDGKSLSKVNKYATTQPKEYTYARQKPITKADDSATLKRNQAFRYGVSKNNVPIKKQNMFVKIILLILSMYWIVLIISVFISSLSKLL